MRDRGPARIFCTLLLLLLGATAAVQARAAEAGSGLSLTLHSQLLGEDRPLLLRLPVDYESSTACYPVIYRLDGEEDFFIHTLAAVRYLEDMSQKIAPHIVVAIPNVDRGRDMSLDRGGETFVRFIETEVVPTIEKNYRADGSRILIGQSFSSVFALYSFLKVPGLFDGYILGSFGLPSDELASRFRSELEGSTRISEAGRASLFIAQGRHDPYDPDGSIARRGAAFLDLLARKAPQVRVLTRVYDDEGHVPFPFVYDGLRWIYPHEGPRQAPRAE